MMFLREINKKKELNFFVTENFGGSFLQSWEWGDFQKSLGRNIWRVGVYKSIDKDEDSEKDNELLAAATVIEHPLGFGLSYLYSPYGPVYWDDLDYHQKEECTRFIMTELRKITQETKNQEEIFVRIEPRLGPDEVGNFFVNEGFKKVHAMQPQDTQEIALNESEAWLLKQMNAKTRYNIRLAERKNIKIREALDNGDMDVFWNLTKLTTARDNFHSHERSYYERLWNFFRESEIDNQMHLTVKILIAEFEKKPIAAIMLGFFGGRVVYLHGAFDHKFRNLMAPHLLQWAGIKMGIKHGYSFYDFNGIKPENRILNKKDKENKWEGVTRFKKSFGGEEVNYAGAWDWPYSASRYLLYRLAYKFLVK